MKTTQRRSCSGTLGTPNINVNLDRKLSLFISYANVRTSIIFSTFTSSPFEHYAVNPPISHPSQLYNIPSVGCLFARCLQGGGGVVSCDSVSAWETFVLFLRLLFTVFFFAYSMTVASYLLVDFLQWYKSLGASTLSTKYYHKFRIVGFFF